MPGSPSLYALVYVSRATRAMTEDDLDALLAECRSHNEAVGLTGFLVYERAEGDASEGTFVQYLEGPRAEVRRVFEERIRPASEHDDIEVKRAGPVEERSFPTWTMAFERASEGALEGFSDLVNKLGPPPAADR